MVLAGSRHAIPNLLVGSPQVLPLSCANLAVARRRAQSFVLIGVVLTWSRVRVLLLRVLLTHAGDSFRALAERVDRFHVVSWAGHILARLFVPDVRSASGANLAVAAAALLAVRLAFLVLARAWVVILQGFVL